MTDIVEPAPDADWPLVERTIAGDQRAYGLLVLKYQRRIQRLVGRKSDGGAAFHGKIP